MSCGDSLRSAVTLSHLFLRERVRPGDAVVDATSGNGHDTLFLARLVGASGRVWSFDIQKEATAATTARVREAGLLDRVELVNAGHEQLARFVTCPLRAVVFNLGYLPGSDKTCITLPGTTIAALDQAAQLLLPGGVLVVVAYPGHDGGDKECRAVDQWAEALSPRKYHAWRSLRLNQPARAAYLLLIEKTPEAAL